MPTPSKPSWSAACEVSAELAAELIREAFSELAPVDARPFGAGWDNTAFLVNGRWVFRFPRRQLGFECLQEELRVLPHLAPLLSLPIPHPRWIGRSGPRFPWPFAGYELLPGQTACQANLSDAERRVLAVPLGRFLRELHSLPVADARAWGAGDDKLGRLDLRKRVPQARERLDDLVARNLLPGREPWASLIDDVDGRVLPQSAVLVHGDLYVRHLLIDASRQLAGVIDWGDVHIGHPAVDLGIAHGFLPPAAHAEFFNAYGPVDDVTWHFARFRALHHALLTTAFSQETGDSDLLRESLNSLSSVAS